MDENEAVDKMRGLKKSIKTALRYERSGEKLPEVFFNNTDSHPRRGLCCILC